jgi:endonuclease/exonuclease/phosphatase family metal-dependent hydrolase
MQFSVLNWNIGGSKFLEEKEQSKRQVLRGELNAALNKLIVRCQSPDVVTLQEIVQYREPQGQLCQILDDIDGYYYIPFILIDTKVVSARAKWMKILNKSDWMQGTYFAQGNAFLIKKGSPISPVWSLSKLNQGTPVEDTGAGIEHVHLDCGLYFGDRNTEPRAALVAHFILDPGAHFLPRKPVDIFVVNLHLTTVAKEREGVPEIDAQATRRRLTQLEMVFDGIVSRYNSWRLDRYPERGERRQPAPDEEFDRHSPVWILAGDFNFTEESEEYAFIKRRNFIDTVSDTRRHSQWGSGTKASGVKQNPTLTLDYVFAGPKFVALDPVIEEKGLGENWVIHNHEMRASDHYPVFSKIEFTPK